MRRNVLGLIPARGGSKGLPRKNLLPLAGRPLIAHTIEAALASQGLSKVVVSTDDEEIAEVARSLGAEVPFLRPAEHATDEATALQVMGHALHALDEGGWTAERLVYLQPTSPLRTTEHIDAALALHERTGSDVVVSVTEVPHAFSPASLLRPEGERLVPYLAGQEQPLRRQDKPVLYARNGPAILVCSREHLARGGGLYEGTVSGFVMAPGDSHDVDAQEDLELIEWLLERRSKGS